MSVRLFTLYEVHCVQECLSAHTVGIVLISACHEWHFNRLLESSLINGIYVVLVI